MLNNCSFLGRLTSTPELKTTQTQKSVSSFTIAVESSYSKEKTNFIPCVAWGKTAEFVCKYFAKGQLICLEAEMQSRTYQDRNGNNRMVVEAVVRQVSFAGYNKESNHNQPTQSTQSTQAVPVPEGNYYEDYDNFDDDLPFN